MRLSATSEARMRYRPNPIPLPRQRKSPTAMATAIALHIAFVWLLLQHAPVQQVIRYVVVQATQPAAPPAATTPPPPPPPVPNTRAITTQRAPIPIEQNTEQPVFSRAPESTVPLQAT